MEATVFYLLMLKKVYRFKENSVTKDYSLCLGNVSKGFMISNMNKTELKGVAIFFSFDFNPSDTNDIIDIYKYLMKRTCYKKMFGLIKKIVIGLLTGPVNGSNQTKCVSLSNRKYMSQLTSINLPTNEYIQEFQYYPFAVKLDLCVGSCDTLNDLSNKVYLPNKTQDLNLRVFNTITGINKSKTLRKHISREY